MSSINRIQLLSLVCLMAALITGLILAMGAGVEKAVATLGPLGHWRYAAVFESIKYFFLSAAIIVFILYCGSGRWRYRLPLFIAIGVAVALGIRNILFIGEAATGRKIFAQDAAQKLVRENWWPKIHGEFDLFELARNSPQLYFPQLEVYAALQRRFAGQQFVVSREVLQDFALAPEKIAALVSTKILEIACYDSTLDDTENLGAPSDQGWEQISGMGDQRLVVARKARGDFGLTPDRIAMSSSPKVLELACYDATLDDTAYMSLMEYVKWERILGLENQQLMLATGSYGEKDIVQTARFRKHLLIAPSSIFMKFKGAETCCE